MTFRDHWPEYLMEAAGLGVFMLSACLFSALLEHPGSSLRALLPDPLMRRLLMGIAMGATAIAIIYSPWGRQSGAHINPSVTVTFLRLGKIDPWDAVFYVAAQFTGAVGGVVLARLIVGQVLAHPAVEFAVTTPGETGLAAAFAAEVAISFGMMFVVLLVSNRPGTASFTGLCAGILVATYITIEAPLSGMSMNPARTLGSAIAARHWTALWIYFTAPVLGMLAAAEVYLRTRGPDFVLCAKLHHETRRRCIFCEYRHGAQGF